VSRIFGAARGQDGARISMACDLFNVDILPPKIRKWQGGQQQTILLLESELSLMGYAEDHTTYVDSNRGHRTSALRMYEHLIANDIKTIHFGYILQSGRVGGCSTHQLRAPATARIDEEVASLMVQQESLARGITDEAVLSLTKGARLLLRIAQDGAGEQLLGIELEEPESNFHACACSELQIGEKE
jgi:hypothetical protein